MTSKLGQPFREQTARGSDVSGKDEASNHETADLKDPMTKVMAVTAVMMRNRRLIVQQVSLQIIPFQALKICSICDHTIPYIKY